MKDQLVFFTDYQCLRHLEDKKFVRVDDWSIVGMPAADPTENPKYVIGNLQNQLWAIEEDLKSSGFDGWGDDIALALEKIECLKKIIGL